MPDLPLSQIERVDVRKAWPHEALDFTRWLAEDENFQALADALHFFEAGVEATEAAVGDFSADIIARDREGLILIENQLAQTDHTHLGQILTYLAGLDEPARVVWISTKVREEHRAAIDWLNAHTPSDFAFFAVELELFRISGGPAAPHYHVVAQPNEWTRHVSARSKQISSTALTDTQETYKALWGVLNDQLMEHWTGFRRRQPLPQTWMSYPIGRAGFQLTAIASVRDRSAAVELYCHRDPSKTGFDQLLEGKAAFEDAFGQPLRWDRMEERAAWRVRIDREVDITDQSAWPDLAKWYRQHLEAFDRTFRAAVADIDLGAGLPDDTSDDA
ncbi:DUF4268 domain-containing protein [Maricaulis maris]|uniref:Uncharacterized protein DUF4268 n=1 Tax=Maricaulis maris TaxID=74318 RepID=A0A495CVW4_9PROT|nr:DUF4268 domain-containing protein [Maricaulis maris]RKQ89519.1 uncharacterized protein DUF4268 [Maricaulis maris]